MDDDLPVRYRVNAETGELREELLVVDRDLAPGDAHDCMDSAVPYRTADSHGWECGVCGAFLQAG